MAHTSPSIFLVWGMLTVFLGAFLISRLWMFDRFKSLRWNRDAHAGVFNVLMTYSYLISIPLLAVWAIGFACIKYDQGYAFIPGRGVIPKPFVEWPLAYRQLVYPLMLCFTFAWALEIITHLEELCFWLFLLNASPSQPSWFKTRYFFIWASGSLIALAAMPITTTFSRNDVYLCEAWTLLIGSAGSFFVTVGFLPILWMFPKFLLAIEQVGVNPTVVSHLTNVHQLNIVRVLFRFIMVCPLLVLGIDGVQPHVHVNANFFWTDLLAMLAGVGCVVSSAITITIFFPRASERRGTSLGEPSEKFTEECPSFEELRSPARVSRARSLDSRPRSHYSVRTDGDTSISSPVNGKRTLLLSPQAGDKPFTIENVSAMTPRYGSAQEKNADQESNLSVVTPTTAHGTAPLLPRRSSRRPRTGDVERGDGHSAVNPMVYSYRSPIDLAH